MPVFANTLIALDLGYSVDFKKKSLLRKRIVEEGGTISYIVTKKCKYVVTSDPEKCDMSSKCRMASKHGLPVLSLDFIWDSLSANKIQPLESYVVGGKSKILDFKSGKIADSKQSDKNKRLRKSLSLFNPKKVKVWSPQDINLPAFDEETYAVAKFCVFFGIDPKSTPNLPYVRELLYIIEIHAPQLSQSQQLCETDNDKDSSIELRYRVTMQHGSDVDLKAGKPWSEEIRFTKTGEQALAVYDMLWHDLDKKQDFNECLNLFRGIGSIKLQKLVAERITLTEKCSEEVKDLVEHVWREAVSELSQHLGDVSKIKIDQLEKAEAILSKIRDCIKESASEADIVPLIDSFYETLHHRISEPQPGKKDRKRWLMTKQDMCQLIKDVISVNEITNFETQSLVESKYAALRCKIRCLEDQERNHVEDLVRSSMDGPQPNITITNVFEVWRQFEDLTFQHKLENRKLLFHSSKVENYVGILSRGLLLPKVIVDEYGGKRSDIGLLGSGIYFASNASTSIQYSMPSKTKGTRLLLMNDVALGNCHDYLVHDTGLTAAPEGFDSTHGVSKKRDPTSVFEDDEFVVYNVDQQRVRYLVEFKLDDDTTKCLYDINSSLAYQLSDPFQDIDIEDVTDIVDPLSKVKPGLIGDGDKQVDLRSVHIRAKLLDLSAQVIVLQEYHNASDEAIEAKYVFPLDDAAVVCGFEAFINGKHIVGEVKEKETAHKEYKKAIKEGHGAYLMDQDEETPDVFTVSVGNLPGKACVLIKITYVAELQVEGELIDFRLPASVAPWKEDAALRKPTQDDLSSHKMIGGQTTVQVAVEMPFDIRSLSCPTHSVKIKQTASKAYVEMIEGQDYGSGFQLWIGLAEIHVPRMWVERHPDDPNHQACMLTFYPEFETSEEQEGEIIIVVDCSNSMKGSALTDAQKVAYLLLDRIPEGMLFNVVKFGSEWTEMAPKSIPMKQENLKIAQEHIRLSRASLGSTDVIHPLRSIFLLPNSKFMRNIFLISDGHISNEELVLNSASLNTSQVRIFTFGVSSTCNSFCMKAVARVSGGAYEYFNRSTKSKWEPKVRNQIRKACQPGLSSVKVDWKQHDDNLPPPTQAPRQITSLYNGSRQVVYGFVPNCTMACLTAKVDGQELSTVVSTSELSITEGMIVHRLSARAFIRDWEDGSLSRDRTDHEIAKMDMKNYIIELSKEYSIVTQLTSFIAVEERDENEKDLTSKGPSMQELVQKEGVDILEYMGWTREPPVEGLPTSYVMSMLAQSVSDKCLSDEFNEKLSIIKEKCQDYIKTVGPCCTDALQVADTMMDAFVLKEETNKAAEFGSLVYQESLKGLDELSEDQYENITDKLRSLREKIQSSGGDLTLPKIPGSKLGKQNVFVQTLTGKTITIASDRKMSVDEFMGHIQDREGIPIDQQRVIFKGKQLDGHKTLEHYKIGSEDVVHMVLRLRGGPVCPEEKVKARKTDSAAVELHMSLTHPLGLDEDMCYGLYDDHSEDKAFHLAKSEKIHEVVSKKKKKKKQQGILSEESVEATSDSHSFFYKSAAVPPPPPPTFQLPPLPSPRAATAKNVLFGGRLRRSRQMTPPVSPPQHQHLVFYGDAQNLSFGAAQPQALPPETLGDTLMEDLLLSSSPAPSSSLQTSNFQGFGSSVKSLKSPAYKPTSSTFFGGSAGDQGQAQGFESFDLGFDPPLPTRLCRAAPSTGGFSSSVRPFKSPAYEHKSSMLFDGSPGGQDQDQGFGSFGLGSVSPQPLLGAATGPSFGGFGSSVRPFELPAYEPTSPMSFGGSAGGEGQAQGFGSFGLDSVPPLPPQGFGSSVRPFELPAYEPTSPMSFGGSAGGEGQAQDFGLFGPADGKPAEPPANAFGTIEATLSSKCSQPLPRSSLFSSKDIALMPVLSSPLEDPVPLQPVCNFISELFEPQALAAPIYDGIQMHENKTKNEDETCSNRLICGRTRGTARRSTGGKYHRKVISSPKQESSKSEVTVAEELSETSVASSSPVSQDEPHEEEDMEEEMPRRAGRTKFTALRSTSGIAARKAVYSLEQESSSVASSSPVSQDESHEEEDLEEEMPRRAGRTKFTARRSTGGIAARMVPMKPKSVNISRSFGRSFGLSSDPPLPLLRRCGVKDEEETYKKSRKGSHERSRERYTSFSLGKVSPDSHKSASSKSEEVVSDSLSRMIESDEDRIERPFEIKKKRKRSHYDEKKSFSLAQFGIGTEVKNVRLSSQRLTYSDITSYQLQQDYWDISSEVMQQIGVDSEVCLKILKASGLYSLGAVVAEDVERLLATSFVLIALAELVLPQLFPLDMSEMNALQPSAISAYEASAKENLLSAGITSCQVSHLEGNFHSALYFCKYVDSRHPMLCSTLELGHDWLSVAATMMNVIKQDTI